MKKPHKWIKKEKRFLKDNYGKLTLKELSRIIKLDKHIIWYRAKNLGLTISEDTAAWSKEEIILLRRNYPIYGYAYCANLLNRSKSSIQNRTRILKIYKKSGVLIDQFLNIRTKEVSYLLGLIWADGSICSDNVRYNISIEIVQEDMKHLLPFLSLYVNWNTHIRKRQFNWKTTQKLYKHNKELYNFLYEYDYKNKSFKSADKILSKIPDNLKHYFFRGISDGDGCFYINKKHSTKQFIVGSTYKQDWFYLENLCNILSIKYTTRKLKKTNSSYSILTIQNKPGIVKLGEYIYKNYEEDKIGLPRKYEKYLEIKNS